MGTHRRSPTDDLIEDWPESSRGKRKRGTLSGTASDRDTIWANPLAQFEAVEACEERQSTSSEPAVVADDQRRHTDPGNARLWSFFRSPGEPTSIRSMPNLLENLRNTWSPGSDKPRGQTCEGIDLQGSPQRFLAA